MSEPDRVTLSDLIGDTTTRSLLDDLIDRSRLYRRSVEYKALLDFVVRLRNFAPFNAMLLQIQKPGLEFAASEVDWWQRFGRRPKEGARPLLILWPFGPVALVYDVADTDGKELPRDVSSFFAKGPIGQSQLANFRLLTQKSGIAWFDMDAGGGKAGSIRCMQRAASKEERNTYRILMNRNHDPVVQFSTLAHELGHLFLGHLGPDKHLSIPERFVSTHAQRELEAESVSFLVCARNRIETNSEKYLADYVTQNAECAEIDVYQVMRAAGQIESLLEIGAHTKFRGRPET